MNKSIIMTLLLFTATITMSSACEICGCGNSSFQIGILPNFTKGFVGIRYSASQFSSVLRSDASQYSRDYFKTVELWGGYNFGKLQVMAFLPYVYSRKVDDDGTLISNGAGDLMMLVNYKIFSSTTISKDETTTLRHDVYAGAGIKLPTGVSNVDTVNPDFNIGDFNSQAGTGSVDYLFTLTHNMMWNRSGIVTNVAYRVNTANQQNYRFGNRSYLNASYYYTINSGTLKIKPSAGVNYQSNAINTFAGAKVEDSNGYNLNGTIGVNLLKDKVGFNAMVFVPVSQDMYDGQTKINSRVLLGVTYSF